MQLSNLPARILQAFATAGSKNAIPQTTSTPGAASFNQGFPALTMQPIASGGVPPSGQDFNGILYALSLIQQWQSAGGGFTYDATWSTANNGYPKGACLLRADGTGFWLCTTDNNTANPDTGGAGWQALAFGAVGIARNLKATLLTAGDSVTFTADELVVKSALGGMAYVLPNFNKTLNIATTGAGGLDTGTAPVSSFIGVYAIYNPTTGASAVIGRAQTSLLPEIYGGANMPAGYTASALISVVSTNATPQLVPFFQRDRRINLDGFTLLTTTAANTTAAALSMAAWVPPNARQAFGWATRYSNVAASGLFLTGDATNGLGMQQIAVGSTSGTGYSGAPWNLDLVTPQTIYWAVQNNVDTSVRLSGFEL